MDLTYSEGAILSIKRRALALEHSEKPQHSVSKRPDPQRGERRETHHWNCFATEGWFILHDDTK